MLRETKLINNTEGKSILTSISKTDTLRINYLLTPPLDAHSFKKLSIKYVLCLLNLSIKIIINNDVTPLRTQSLGNHTKHHLLNNKLFFYSGL